MDLPWSARTLSTFALFAAFAVHFPAAAQSEPSVAMRQFVPIQKLSLWGQNAPSKNVSAEVTPRTLHHGLSAVVQKTFAAPIGQLTALDSKPVATQSSTQHTPPSQPVSFEGQALSPARALPGTSGGSASIECDAEQWMAPYLTRAAGQHDVGMSDFEANGPSPGYLPWWDQHVRAVGVERSLQVGVDWLVQSALRNSPYIRAVSTEPHIKQSLLVEESAEFDWRSFLETTYDDFNDPVGNTLTTGDENEDRFKDKTWSESGGFRRKNLHGGELEISQQLGRQSNNSVFLLPNPQGTTRLELNYTQPLLNGAGRPYNQSRIVLARIDRNSSHDDVYDKLQTHLQQVTQAYWELYQARARFFQRQKLLGDAVKISQNLADREQVDALYRQVLRAKAAVARRRSEIARARTQIRNAEAQLRLLVNDPALVHTAPGDLTPVDAPSMAQVNVSMGDSLATALSHRPDISRAIRAMRSTNVRLGVARNEILPKLDLLVSSYVAGLEENSQIFQALGNQFADGRPGFSVGLLFEMPIGNRAANARYQRRRWELVRAVNQFQLTVENSLTEVELAVREVQTAYQEMQGKYHAMLAAQDETNYLYDRFETLPGANDSATLLLEDLLDSQERLADEEAAFVDAQVTYSTSLVELRRAMGTLLRCQDRPYPVSTSTLSDIDEGISSLQK